MSVQEELRPTWTSGAVHDVSSAASCSAWRSSRPLWIVTVPPFRASDEFDHAYRAAAVARGQWRAHDEAADDGRGTLVRVPADLVAAAHDQCADLPYTGHDNCNPAERNDDGTVLVGSGPAVQPGLLLGGRHGGAAVPRCRGALRHAGRLGAALPALHGRWPRGRLHWAARVRGRASGLLLATSPVFVFSTTVAAPNGLEMAAALALWCLLLRAPDVEDPRDAATHVVLAASRPLASWSRSGCSVRCSWS